MIRSVTEHRPISMVLREILPRLYISTMVEDYLNAKKHEGISEGTLEIFHHNLIKFKVFSNNILLKNVIHVDVILIRNFMN